MHQNMDQRDLGLLYILVRLRQASINSKETIHLIETIYFKSTACNGRLPPMVFPVLRFVC